MNLEVAKVQYELLNHPVEQIALDNNLPVTVINYAVEHKGWKRRPIGKALLDIETDEDAVLDKVTALSILKDATLLPGYIALETAIIQKAMEMVKDLPPELPSSGDVLQKIEKVFTSLAGSQSLFARVKAAKEGSSGSDNRLQVVIQNKFENGQ